MTQRPNRVSLEDLDKAPLSPPVAQSRVDAGQWREKFTEVADENFSLKEQISILRQKLNTKNILDDMLKPYANYAYGFMCVYSLFVALVLLMNGFGCFKNPVPETVMQFLVGSTAATVIGLVGMVLTGIFVGARK